MKAQTILGALVLSGCFLAVVRYLPSTTGNLSPPARLGPTALAGTHATDGQTAADKIVASAKKQAAKGALYAPEYFVIPYPNGDLPADKGVCTDVVVRALRSANYDLQKLIHEDMKRNFGKYPNNWGLSRPDPNIDHRRVPNQMRFFERHGLSLTLEVSKDTLDDWQPGDIVYWKLDSGLDHCGVLTDTRNENGEPLVVHNLGRCVEENCLTKWRITGHFRFPKKEKE